MTSERSVPLSEALERFSDPSEWKELRSLEPYAITIFVLGEPETESDRLHRRYHRLKERLGAEFLDKLITGSLVATGFVWPIGLNPKRRAIPATRWHKLEPDFEASEATGGGLRIVEIRVEQSQPTRTRSSHPSPANEHVPREHASLARLRRALRRWLQREAQARGRSWYKRQYCEAARKKYGDRVTDNLFNEVWRLADLPGALREPGLRKNSDLSTDSSPPD
jgi:hypothetical protein